MSDIKARDYTYASSEEKAIVGWKALPEIRKRFRFSDAEMVVLLGLNGGDEYQHVLKLGPKAIAEETLLRISYLLGMMKALRTIFKDSNHAYSWIDRSNNLPPFKNKTPREFLMSGDIVNLKRTRQFLDSWSN